MYCDNRDLHAPPHSFPTRRSSDLTAQIAAGEFTLHDLCELDSATYGNTTSFVSTQARDQKTDNYLFGGGFIFERGPGRVKFDLAYQESTFINEVVIVDVGKRLEEVVVESNAGIGAQYEFTGNPLNDPSDFRLRNGQIGRAQV